ncbi:hypothetical protein GCM10010102_17220 [Promicromonospora citrea]|uniref:Uncharacterized protein n=1 Tax=Promicromonospora citrea TaxID=43677 RepID=A0A8H9L3M5_9MICO|nr:hypothetical protein GCM10010102_17220 [Promicromonospora citrea]
MPVAGGSLPDPPSHRGLRRVVRDCDVARATGADAPSAGSGFERDHRGSFEAPVHRLVARAGTAGAVHVMLGT